MMFLITAPFNLPLHFITADRPRPTTPNDFDGYYWKAQKFQWIAKHLKRRQIYSASVCI